MKKKVYNLNLSCFIVLVIFSLVVLIGYRPISVGTDTAHYIYLYNTKLLNPQYTLKLEYLFKTILEATIYWELSYNVLFMLVAFISSLWIIYLALKLFTYLEEEFSYYRIVLLLFSLLFLSPFFFLSEVNVIRQGVASVLLFLVYFSVLKRSWISGGLLALTALGFHKTTVLYLLGVPILYCFNYISILRIGLAFSLFYVCNINQYLVQQIPYFHEQIVNYGGLAAYKRGTRYDFALFTVGIGLLLHLVAKYLLNKKGQHKFYPLLSIYWLLTIPFFIAGFGAYSDRYLLPSWLWLSILATVLGLFTFKRFNFSINYYFILFMLSFIYFFLKVQGIII